MVLKPGIKTTELLLAVLTDVGVVAAALSGVLPAKWAAIAASVSTLAYSVSRGLAKTATPSVTIAVPPVVAS